jgi:hypothetical protein
VDGVVDGRDGVTTMPFADIEREARGSLRKKKDGDLVPRGRPRESSLGETRGPYRVASLKESASS